MQIYDKNDMRYRYMSDSKFKNLVDLMTSYIMQAEFTPSEVREAAMLASIKYEQYAPHRFYFANHIIERELDKFNAVVNEELYKESGKKQHD